jgi:SAM-dependent methyltransferase
MKINEIIKNTEKPILFTRGTHIMWTDPHISEQLQAVHLNGEIDLATRKDSSRFRTIQWILKQAENLKNPMEILELGCGPGLYTEQFAKMGHNVTGIDFSKRSIQTSRARAAEMNLSIKYICGNYVDLPLGVEKFDLIYLIYTDFCVLNPQEQDNLLKSVFRALKTGGLFLFDVNHPIRMKEKVDARSWEAEKRGFWSNKPYLVINESFPYFEHKTILGQHQVITDEEIRVYRFWTRFFDEKDLRALLTPHGFENLVFFTDILEDDGQWNGDNILFCRAEKLINSRIDSGD